MRGLKSTRAENIWGSAHCSSLQCSVSKYQTRRHLEAERLRTITYPLLAVLVVVFLDELESDSVDERHGRWVPQIRCQLENEEDDESGWKEIVHGNRHEILCALFRSFVHTVQLTMDLFHGVLTMGSIGWIRRRCITNERFFRISRQGIGDGRYCGVSLKLKMKMTHFGERR